MAGLAGGKGAAPTGDSGPWAAQACRLTLRWANRQKAGESTMPGPTHPRDDEDPRENTVDLPRFGRNGKAASLSGPAANLRPVQPGPAAVPVPSIQPTAAAPPTAATPPAAPIPLAKPSGDPAVPPSRPLAAGTVSRPTEMRPEAPAAAADRFEPERDASRFSRPPAGSLADLRSRLARLPDGHPSAPYDDGGTARPLPIRLKQLELGLPAPEPDRSQPGRLTARHPDRTRLEPGDARVRRAPRECSQSRRHQIIRWP